MLKLESWLQSGLPRIWLGQSFLSHYYVDVTIKRQIKRSVLIGS